MTWYSQVGKDDFLQLRQNEKWSDALRRKLAIRILGKVPLHPLPPELPPITPEQLAEIQMLFPMKKYFIFGFPRSGTTMLMRLLRVHPEVHSNEVAHFFTRQIDAASIFSSAEIRGWMEKRSNRWTAGKSLETSLVRCVFDYVMEIDARQAGKHVVGDKTPNYNNGEAVRRMHAIYPDAYLVNIIRDGRDAVMSHRFQYFIDHPEYLKTADRLIREDFKRDDTRFFAKERSLFTPASLREETELWVDNVTETDRLGKELYGEHYCGFRYEDFLTDPVGHLCRIWSMLGVAPEFPEMQSLVLSSIKQNPGAVDQQKKEGKIARNLPRGRQGGWRELFTQADRQLFKDIAGQTLITWGYEKNLDW